MDPRVGFVHTVGCPLATISPLRSRSLYGLNGKPKRTFSIVLIIIYDEATILVDRRYQDPPTLAYYRVALILDLVVHLLSLVYLLH